MCYQKCVFNSFDRLACPYFRPIIHNPVAVPSLALMHCLTVTEPYNKQHRYSLYLAIVEVGIGIRQTRELSGAAVEVDVAGPEGRQEAHLRLPCVG